MNDLTGYPELTPHKGGWCGNDIFPEALSPEHLDQARRYTRQARRPAGARGLPRLPRGRLSRRRGHRRALPRRAQSPHQRRDVDDQRHGRGLRRHPALPLPPARVPGSRLRARRRRDQRAVGERLDRRRVEPARLEGHGRRRGAPHERAEDGHLADGRRRRDRLRALGQRLALDPRRARGVLPARARAGRLPLPGRRPRLPGVALAHAERGEPADEARLPVDRRDPRPVRRGGGAGGGGGRGGDRRPGLQSF